MKNISKQNKAFLFVYISISIATLYHSAFGFGTLDGLPNDLDTPYLMKWWFLGFLCATSIDVGMGAIVYSMINGNKSKFLTISLITLAFFSAYSQLVYTSHHSTDLITKTNNNDLKKFMQFVLDIRIIVLPLCLPFFSLFYAFSAKNLSSDEESNVFNSLDNSTRMAQDGYEEETQEYIKETHEIYQEYNNISKTKDAEKDISFDQEILSYSSIKDDYDNISSNDTRKVHYIKDNGILCGINQPISKLLKTKYYNKVTCKNCRNIANNQMI